MSSLLLNTPPPHGLSPTAREGSTCWPSSTPSQSTTNLSPTAAAAKTPHSQTRIEELAKKLEETCERVCRDAGISAMKNDPDSAAYIPLRIREIVQEHLTPSRVVKGEEKERRREIVRYVEMVREGKERGELKEGREDRELERVRQQLAISKKHNEELSQKYISVSEKVEEVFHLKAEVSKLTFEQASLKAVNAELQRTLLDQETSFSFSLRSFQSEKTEKELLIGRLEEQLKQSQRRTTKLELDMSTKQTLAEREKMELNSEIIRLREDMRKKLEEVDTARREGREEMERLQNDMEEIRKEADVRIAVLKRKNKEEMERIRISADEKEILFKKDLKKSQERIDREEKRVKDLTLINDHLQEQLKESHATRDDLSEKTKSLSLSLSDIQSKMREIDMQNKHLKSESQKAKIEVIESKRKLEEASRDKERAMEEMNQKMRDAESQLQRVQRDASQRDTETGILMRDLKQEIKVLKLCHMDEEKKLSDRVKEMKLKLEREAREKERLAREIETTQETLVKQKSQTEDEKHQRTVLNATVASLAREKADILREKVALEVRVQSHTDTLETQKKKLLAMTEEINKLQITVNDYEKRVFLAELNKSFSSSSISQDPSTKVLSSSVASLKLTLHSNLPHISSERRDELLKECKPLCDILVQLTERESKLRVQLQEATSQYETDKEDHHGQVEVLRIGLKEERERWKLEMEELRKSHKRQLEKMRRQVQSQMERKEAEIESKSSEWQKEKDSLRKQISSERQKANEEKQKMAASSRKDSEQLASTQHKVKELERERERLLNRQNILLSSKEDLTVTVSTVEQRNSQLESSLTSKFRQLEETKQRLHDKESEVTELRENGLKILKEKEEEVREVKIKLAKSQADCEKHKREKDGMESVLVATKAKCSSLEGELQVIRKEHLTARMELESVSTDLKETEIKYTSLLASVQHIVIGEGRGRGPVSAEEIEEAFVRLQNERDSLRDQLSSSENDLQQLRHNIDCSMKEKEKALNRVKSLRESQHILQKKLDHSIKLCSDAEEEERKSAKRLEALQIEHSRLKSLASDLESRVKSMTVQKTVFEGRCDKLKEDVAKAAKTSKGRSEEVLKLTHTITVLKASQLTKEREMADLESRLMSTQRGALEKEVALKNTERKIALLEQKLAQYEQQNLRQETTKQELQTRVAFLKSQMTEIKERAKNLRQELVISETERETLRGDVHELSMCLQTTTREKERLSQSQEREIGRLRGEVKRRLQENSDLKLEMVQSSTSQQSSVYMVQTHQKRSYLHIAQATTPKPQPDSNLQPSHLPSPPTASSTPKTLPTTSD